MKLLRVGAFLMLAGAAAACTKDTAGTVVVLDSLAGLRYMNFVSDTTAVDFRIVDVVSAPAQIAATFRTGGQLNGISLGGATPVYSPVAAGTRHIRVFLNGGSPSVSSTILLDTSYTFASNTNYSFYLYGYAKAANGTPALNALIVQDTAPTLTATQIAVRVLDLAPTLSGNPAGAGAVNLDGIVGLVTSAVPIGAASFSNLTVGSRTAYVPFAVTTGTQVYRLALTATGTGNPIVFQAPVPVGAAGTSTAQPAPGSAVAGTVITAVLVPRSVAGSGAPQTTAAAVTTNIDSVTRNVDTVTVWRRITPGNGTTTCNTAVGAGAAANSILNVTGLTQPQYNGAQAVMAVTAGTSQTLDTARQTVTLAAGVAGNTFTLKFGTATTGAISYVETAAGVQAALGALSTIGGTANVGVTGPTGGPYVVVFKGTFLGTNPVAAMTTTTSAVTFTATVTTNFNCLGTATSSRFRYRIAGTPVSPATGAPSFKVVTSGTADFASPSVLFMFDILPARTAP